MIPRALKFTDCLRPACALVLLWALPAHGQSADPAITAAEQAMAAHLPEVAVEKLNVLLSGTTLDDTQHARAQDDLTTGQERFVKAEALAALGQWADALPLYAAAANDATAAANGSAGLQQAATLGHAEALHALDRNMEARALLALLASHSSSPLVQLRLAELDVENADLDSARALLNRCKPATPLEGRWFQYVQGRLYLAEQQDAPALESFQDLLNNPSGLTPALHAGATVGLTEARIALNGLEAADNVLEDFIWQHPDSPYLEEMFRRLDHIYGAEESPSDSELQHWSTQPPARRAALAQYYQAHSLQDQDRREKAIHAYTEFVQRYPTHPLAFEAWMQLGNLYLDKASIPQAINAFDSAMRFSADDLQRARAAIPISPRAIFCTQRSFFTMPQLARRSSGCRPRTTPPSHG
jgi:tetratricopeptide (TPR) repeat protein